MPFPGCPWPSLLQSPAPLPRMKIGWKISDFYLFWTCFDWKIIKNIVSVSLDHKIRLHDITRMADKCSTCQGWTQWGRMHHVY